MGERIVRGDRNNDRTHPNLDTSGEDEDGGLDGALRESGETKVTQTRI